MDNFQEFIREFRPQHFAVGGLANLVINTVVMWLVVNHMISSEGKVSLLRCAVCVLLLYIVSSCAVALLLVPVPLVFILAAVVWLVGSLVVIRSVFELTYQGGGGILFLNLLVLVAIHGLVRQFTD